VPVLTPVAPILAAVPPILSPIRSAYLSRGIGDERGRQRQAGTYHERTAPPLHRAPPSSAVRLEPDRGENKSRLAGPILCSPVSSVDEESVSVCVRLWTIPSVFVGGQASSFASIVILAFNTLETGQPAFALFAAASNA
jgi:hypothetical protein